MSNFNAQAVLDEAARKINAVVDGFIAVFRGGPTTTVNNGSVDLPSIQKLLTDADLQINTGADSVLSQSVAAKDESSDWARKTDGSVDGVEYSAKSYAVGGEVNPPTGSAKGWATTVGTEVVAGEGYSARQYAQDSGASAAAAAVARSVIESVRDAVLLYRGAHINTANALSKGVYGINQTANGSGGTNGTFSLAFSGGAGSGAAGIFVVASGAVVSTLITANGYGYTSAPAVSYAASAGLTGAAGTSIIANNADVGEHFSVPTSGLADKSTLYRVDAGPVATPVVETPGANSLSKAVKAGSVFAAIYPGLPSPYPSGMAIRDDAGRLRLVDVVINGELERYGTIKDEKVAKLAGLSILATRNDLPDIYPRSLTIVRDTLGKSRIVEGFTLDGDYANYAAGAGTGGAGGNVEAVANEYQPNNSIGQSNERGNGDSTLSPVVAPGVGLAWDPGSATAIAMADPLPGNAAGAGSMIPAQTNEFFRLTGRGTFAVLSAQGGSSMQVAADSGNGFWDPATAGNLLVPAFTRLENAKTWLRANNYAYCLTPSWTWCQGERDAQAINEGAVGASKAGYKAAFIRMYDAIQAAYPKSKIFITRTGKQGAADSTGFQQIRDAQDELAQELPHVVMAYTGFVRFFERGLTPDGLHAGQPGLNEMGRKRGRVMAYAISNYA